MEYYSAIKNEIMPLAATWMDLDIIILSKSDTERQILYDITYMWNLKNNTDESIYKTETDSQLQLIFDSRQLFPACQPLWPIRF